ncbi:hypothetical protein BKA65DRAFT_531693 [Rhexocercosporidium sp. MPI-PUGE-AT-0058]|nr:hypothetical protein BKA65DRAFT_531693 [Rhexocercosporidium sp. MPI-PUGE-AT-0058]
MAIDVLIGTSVKDLNRPTLVYNCYNVLVLCKTVKRHLGAATSATFHYDRWAGNTAKGEPNRKDTRRSANCPSVWISTPRADGSNRCPEPDQPRTWKSKNTEAAVTRDTIMMRRGSGELGDPVVIDQAQLAKIKKVQNDQGAWVDKYIGLGAAFTCDEFPAASWIEGGAGASIYCAPDGSLCMGLENYLTSEQGWQSAGHRRIQTWFKKVAGTPLSGKNDRKLTIYKFDFKYADEENNGNVVWLEQGGYKRYCYGPSLSTGDDCKPDW